MTESEYLSFQQCRLANFITRGRHLLCDWLRLNQDSVERKDLELFAYLLRVLLSAIVDQAIRNRAHAEETGFYELREVKGRPISIEEYHEAVDKVKEKWIMGKIEERDREIEAFQVYHIEQQQQEATGNAAINEKQS